MISFLLAAVVAALSVHVLETDETFLHDVHLPIRMQVLSASDGQVDQPVVAWN